MKSIVLFLTMTLLCSCHQDISDKEDSDEKMTRLDEVIKIWSEYGLKKIQERYPDKKIIIVNDRSEFDKDVFAMEYPDTEYEIYEEDKGFEFRGPLTKEQVVQEVFQKSDPSDERAPKVASERFNEGWHEFLSRYREGDEFYYYRSSKKAWAYGWGSVQYILIRDNECLGSFIVKLR